jgi:hypothetical protein
MKASDVTDTLNLALVASGCDSAKVVHRPRLLSDNGSSYISGALAARLSDKGMDHIRGVPMHPQTQGKIERWHQTLKNRILLENCCLPGDLELKIADFVSHYNHLRYHESIANLTPADVYFGRGQTILLERERIKHQTFKTRRLLRRKNAAQAINPDVPAPPFPQAETCSILSDDRQCLFSLSMLRGLEMVHNMLP